MEIEMQKLQATDTPKFTELLQVFEDVFEMKEFSMLPIGYLRDLLGREGFMVFVAIHNGVVIGGLTAHVLPSYYFQSHEVYIYDLAVKRDFQRIGVGRRLMEGIISHCRERGDATLFVQADLEDTHALDFYRSTGGTAEDVVHFNYPLNS